MQHHPHRNEQRGNAQRNPQTRVVPHGCLARQRVRTRDHLLQLGQRGAGGNSSACLGNASLDGVGHIGGVQGHACVQAHDVLRSAHTDYGFKINQPTSFTPPGELVVNTVSECRFAYNDSTVLQRNGLISLWLKLTREGESVSLQQQINVDNTP